MSAVNASSGSPERDLVFFSYRHDAEGKRWLSLVRGALEPYRLTASLVGWSDHDIRIGEQWHSRILAAIERTRVAVLLVNHSFFASEYICQQELPRLIADAHAGRITLVCMLIGPVDPELLLEHGLAGFQFPHDLHISLNELSKTRRERTLVEVAVAVKKAYGAAGTTTATPPVLPPAGRQGVPVVPVQAQLGNAPQQRRLFEVPALPRHFVARDDELHAIRTQLLHGQDITHGLSAAPGLGLHGMGGMGKSVMAQALCHDSEVGLAFPDGIAWLALGQQPDVLALQNQLLRHFTSAVAPATGISKARQQLRDALEQRRVLIVVDDIWDARHFEPFDVVGPQGRVLVTTRDASILTQVGARLHPLHRLLLAPAQELLARWSGCPVGQLPKPASQVVELIRGLPLALALAGAQVADGVSWCTLVEQLRRGQIDFLDHPYASVYVSLGRSFDHLSDTEQERYLDLAAFPEEEAIAEPVVARLWQYTGGLNAAATEKLLARLERKALLSLAGDAPNRSITLHDLQRDFLRLRCDDLSVLHAQVLDAYRHAFNLPLKGQGWAQLPLDEIYIWRHLAMHLVAANRSEELYEVLLSFEWISARLASEMRQKNAQCVADIGAMQRDYERYAARPETKLVGRAIAASGHVIAQYPETLAQQLFGRLGRHAEAAISALSNVAHKYIRQHDAWIPCRSTLESPSALLQVCTGHTQEVNGILILSDGKQVLSWSWDSFLRIYDLEQPGSESRVLSGHLDGVHGALLIDNEKGLISWSQDRTLRLWRLTEAKSEPQVLRGHKGSVAGALLLPNKKQVLSWSRDFTLRLWDLDRPGFPCCSLEGHKSQVDGALLLSDGHYAVSWSWDRTLRLWDLTQPNAEPIVMSGHEGSIDDVLLLPDGHRILSCSRDGTLRLWDTQQLKVEERVFQGHKGSVCGALIMPGGSQALSWSLDRTLRLWQLDEKEAASLVFEGHQGTVNGALALGGGEQILSWSADGTLRLWDIAKPDADPRVFSGHSGPIYGVLLLSNERRALSRSMDGTLRLWDLQHPEVESRVLHAHENEVGGMLLLPGEQRAISWSVDTMIRVWDLEQPLYELPTLARYNGQVQGVATVKGSQHVISWSIDQTLCLWDLDQPNAEPRIMAGHNSGIEDVEVLNDLNKALSCSWDGTLRLWDLTLPDAKSVVFTGHENAVVGAVVLPDRSKVLSWSEDRTLRLWDLLNPNAAPCVLEGHSESVYGALMLPGSQGAVSWSEDSTLRIWDFTHITQPKVLRGHESTVNGALLFSCDKRMLSWSADGTLRLWNIELGGTELQILEGHKGSINGAMLLPDGTGGHKVLSWSEDSTLRLWSLQDSTHNSLVLTGHTSSVYGARILQKGKGLISWSQDGKLQLWELDRPNAEPQTLCGHNGKIYGVRLINKGRFAVSWSEDRTIRLWDLESYQPIAIYSSDATVTAAVVSNDETKIFVGDAIGGVQVLELNII